ncbi:sensor histidine kinase [Aggregatilineales bacterium SYSU G02658]
MNPLTEHLHHMTHFDGLLHWCFLLALVGFPLVMGWIALRVLLPLHRLARQTERIASGELNLFDAPVGGIGEIEKLRRSLQMMVAQVAAAQQRELMYRSALTESQENERQHIAREIHDETIQSLVVVSHSLERALQTCPPTSHPHLQAARQQIVTTVDSLRQMIANLRPTVLDELGLAAAIETLCERDSRLSFVVEGMPTALPHAYELALFRAAQEAIHNAERHADFNRVEITLHYDQAGVSLSVTDDGRGFHVPVHLREFALHGHYGLIGLRERIEHLGGTFTLESTPHQGTHLSVHLPVTHMVRELA